MFLILGSLCLSLCLVFVYITLLASRASKPTLLTGDTTIGSAYVPLLLGFGAMGIVFMIRFYQTLVQSPPENIHLIWAAAILASALGLAVLLHNRLKRLPKLAEPATFLNPASGIPPGDQSGPFDTPPQDKGEAA